MKIYKAENLINFRDLGGYKTTNGITAEGKAFRCGLPKAPTENDVRLLKELGIKHIIDLRGREESCRIPSYFLTDDYFDYKQFNLLEAVPSLDFIQLTIWEMYLVSLREHGKDYAEVIRFISTLKEPFLFHCFLGKDRTGLLSAILLDIAGADREDILKNYEASYELIMPFINKEIENNTGLIWEQDEARFRTDRELMIKTLDMVQKNLGGFREYLKSNGLTDEEITRASAVLL